tara:strand:- start:2954 stop:3094 length:141 start_codon:yes stop_codon:yes gene_type:complete
MSKGSSRRAENLKNVKKNIEKIDWSMRDKKKDTFIVKLNGKVVKND